jgi:hypothetical protein
MPKGRLSQLPEEPLANLGEEDRDLVFVVLLRETGVVKED